MKNFNNGYSTEADVNAIVCDLNNVELLIFPTQENELKIDFDCKRADICRDESRLTIKQSKSAHLFSRKKKLIKIFVPDHTVPEITVSGKNCKIKITNGIYGQLSLSGDDCSLELDGCSFTDCSLTGTTLSTYLKGVTVKNTIAVKCDAGDMIWENCFAACTQCRVKRGNIGLSGFNCKDSIMEAENGNVAARLDGDESEYNLGLVIKEGTANRESVQREGAARSFKAYSAKGNIAIDFIPDGTDEIYGDN